LSFETALENVTPSGIACIVNVILMRQTWASAPTRLQEADAQRRRAATRGFSPAAAARHSKFGIPVGGFLHCIVFLGVPRQTQYSDFFTRSSEFQSEDFCTVLWAF